MATNGITTVQVTEYNYLNFVWRTESQSAADNTSTVSWELYLYSTSNGKISSTADKYCNITVDGRKYGFTGVKVAIENNSTKRLAEGKTVIQHDSDGKKTFSYSFSQYFGITFSGQSIGTISGSGAGVLDAIPREAKITSAPNFTDEENPTITYSNPAGSAVIALQACISIVGGSGGDDIRYRDIPATETSYTFNLTDAERSTLINAVKSGNSIQVRFYIATNIGGIIYRSYVTKTFSIVGANPVISSASAKDVSAKALALTGNERYWIKGISDISYNVTAIAQKGASISKYSITCGNNNKTSATGTMEQVASDTIFVNVTDTRNNSTSTTIRPERWIDYNGLTCTATKGQLDVGGVLNFTVTGVYFMGSFGATSNDLTVGYRYRLESETEYSAWATLPLVASTNSYNTSGTIEGLDYRENYALQFYAQDKLQTVYSPEYLIHKAEPIFDWDANDFKFNVNTFAPSLTVTSPLGLNSMYPDGEIKDVVRVGQTNGTLYVGAGGKNDTDNSYATYVGGDSVYMAGNKYAFIEAPSGVYINNNVLNNHVMERGIVGNWYYQKWTSGLVEMWGKCEAVYGNTYYLSKYEAFPVELTSWISAIGTVNGFAGNLSAYLPVNVKIECMNYGCNVWVQNSNNSFKAGDSTTVSLHIVGVVARG